MILERRSFLTLPGLTVAAMAATTPPRPVVQFTSDGLALSPLETSRLLASLAEQGKITADSYSQKGSVEELEKRFAADLGKERAVFFPTGTLANHVAVRLLARGRPKVLVQRESHLYNDCGDCAQTLSALNLVPLASGKATFTLAEVEEVLAREGSGRVEAPVSAMMIESPVRRKSGEMFDFEEMKRITAFARQKGIGLHLDGARIYLAAGFTGIPSREYAALFDTVYVSLYKYFNAPSGAILAGPRQLLDAVFHMRRMFGGGLNQCWPFAAVALHYVEGFADRYRRAVDTSERLFRMLEETGRFRIERIPNGSNIVLLHLLKGDRKSFVEKLATKGIAVAVPPGMNACRLTINESVIRRSPEELAQAFVAADSALYSR